MTLLLRSFRTASEVMVGGFVDGGCVARFILSYGGGFVEAIALTDRAASLLGYSPRLLMPGQRQSVDPMAAVTAQGPPAAQHWSLLNLVGNAPWSNQRVLAKVRGLLLSALEQHRPIEARIIRGTGLLKKGWRTVGVTRQHCGQLGKQDD